MTKLKVLRRRIAALRRWRRRVRVTTACSAALTALLWTLLIIFAVDFAFEMDMVQRIVVMLVGAIAVVWAYRRYTAPLLGVRETDMEMALLVERQHSIRSDLVAALQFESPEAPAWGSSQLEGAVIDYAAGLSRGLDVFAGFSREQMMRRAMALLATCAVVAALCYAAPEHARIFGRRLLLASDHYPSKTIIQQVAINADTVLVREHNGTQPSLLNSPEGHPLAFLVQCSGKLPDGGEATLRSANGQRRPLELERLTLDQRKLRLEDARSRIRRAIDERDIDTAGPWARDVAGLVMFDAPDAAEWIHKNSGQTPPLANAIEDLNAVLKSWPSGAESTAIYAGRLGRLVESVTYQLYLGDAWTDAADVRMIPLPVIQPQLTPIPPGYAKTNGNENLEPSARQISVLEGSEVAVSLECVNKKRLVDAWLTVTSTDPPQRYSLASQDDDGLQWKLVTAATPFARIDQELRFEMQVTDADGLHMQSAIRGYIRIRVDRPPTCAASVVHRVVLPTATPSIEFRVNDDYGIARLLLHIQLERAVRDPDQEAVDLRRTLVLLDGPDPILSDRLPLSQRYELSLASLQIVREGAVQPADLVKGDRLKLTLEAVDYRGDLTGESYLSDPLVLEISDESGVLSAISEADERSEQRLTDIIKQQLGIGESP